MTKTTKNTALAVILAGGVAVGLAGCETTYSVEKNRLPIDSYEPVIDLGTSGVDRATYLVDLDDCRRLGARVQADYEARRLDEQARARRSAVTGAVAGAVVGSLWSDATNADRSDGAVAGALYGGAIGAGAGEDQIDTDRSLTRFGGRAVVDECMTGRGYKVLVQERVQTRTR